MRGKAARSRAARESRTAAEIEREEFRSRWLEAMTAATVPTLDTSKVRGLAIKSMKTNPAVVVTEPLVEQVVGLIVDAWKGPGDSDWWKGSIDIDPTTGHVEFNRFSMKKGRR